MGALGLGLGLGLLVVVSCGDDGGGGPSGSAKIGPGGGTLTVGEVTLEIPSGALVQEEAIGIREVGLSVPGYDGLTALYEFTPRGLRLAKNARVTFRTRGSAEVGQVAWSNPDDTTLVEQDAELQGEKLTTEVSHFSRGAAVLSQRCGLASQPCCRITACRGGFRCGSGGSCALAGPVADASTDAPVDAPVARDGGVELTPSCVRVVGGSGFFAATSATALAGGAIAIAAAATGTNDYGEGPVVSAEAEGVLGVFNTTCSFTTLKRFGSPGGAYLRWATTDATGKVVVVGIDLGATDFGSGPLAAGKGIVVGRYDSALSPLLIRKYPYETLGNVSNPAISPTDRLVLGGGFAGTITFGTVPLAAGADSGSTMFVGSLEPDLDEQWSKRFLVTQLPLNNGNPVAATQLVYATAVDSGGNVYLAGKFNGGVDMGSGSLTNTPNLNGTDSVVLTKLTSSGAHLWTRSYPSTTHSVSMRLAENGDPVLALGLRQPQAVPGGTVPAGAAVLRFDSTGQLRWGRSFGSDLELGLRVGAVDPATGDIWLGGTFRGTRSFGGPTFTSVQVDGGQPSEDNDAVLVRLSGEGDHLWSTFLGGPGADSIDSIVVTPAGGLFMTGYFARSITLMGVDYTAGGTSDTFLLHMKPKP